MLLSFLYLFIAGLLGGFIAGMVGIGGGVIYVFIIPLALRYIGVPEAEIPQYTIANSFFAILFASASANYVLVKHKLFYKKEVAIISILAIVISYFTLEYIVNTPWYSLELFNSILIVLLLYMLFSTLISAKKVYVTPLDDLNKYKLSVVGAAGGFIAALSGLGGGIVIIPILNSLMRIDIKKASYISSGVIMITAFTITIHNLLEKPIYDYKFYNAGYIIFPIALTLSLGVVIASPFGVKTARNLSSTSISYIYASFLIVVILKKIIELYLIAF
ncbi:MAG: sulfite exporter TauE/SafE family protein [Cytophagaceae bacterium]|nr:sulfite exporter TauE/SafE family protein [Cytophagaceae bacterium]